MLAVFSTASVKKEWGGIGMIICMGVVWGHMLKIGVWVCLSDWDLLYLLERYVF